MASKKTYAELIAYFETGDKPTQAQFEDLIYTLMNGLSVVPKKYVALLTQTGTDAPVATVLCNTFGGTLVWSYDAAGQYVATLVGAFASAKTVIKTGTLNDPDQVFFGSYNDDDSINVSTSDAGTKTDELLSETWIEIEVYP